jgi:hypothetical protein
MTSSGFRSAGPLAQQANALKALEAAMKPFADVTVEQGTISVG